jgi:hypothetical protein
MVKIRLTLSIIKHNQYIIMLPGIFNLIQAHKPSLRARPSGQSPLRLLHLALTPSLVHRQSKFGVHHLKPKLPALFGEGEELDNVVLFDDLEADGSRGPLLVDGDDHAAAGDGESGCDTVTC